MLPASLNEPDLAIEGLTDPDAIEDAGATAKAAQISSSSSSTPSAESSSAAAGRARANDSTRVLLDIGGGDSSAAANAVNPKERPVWLAESTIEPSLTAGGGAGAAANESDSEPDSKRARKSEIMQLILTHELLPKGSNAHAKAVAAQSQSRAPATAILRSADVSDMADFSRCKFAHFFC